MADIYVAIRNAQRVAMSSVNGTLVVVLLVQARQVVDQQAADLSAAMTIFRGVPAGDYTVLARHSDLTPTEARYDHVLTAKTVLGVRFVYNEPQCTLITIEAEANELP